jgi:aminomethyltransferase
MADPTPLKRTPLWEAHRSLGAKMVPYAGFEMPVQYPTGILAEHQAVRTGAGLFDVSHMGEFEVIGPDRNAFVNRITCNDVAAMETGHAQYSALLTPQGTFIDDCLVYRFADRLMLVVNAANIAKDWGHVVGQKGSAAIRLRNISDSVGLLALQGPRAEALLQPFTSVPLASIGYYRFVEGAIDGVDCFISRTGYTGEDGFELYCRAAGTVPLWQKLTGAGATPVGLGARDSLRLEVGFPLYGNDIDDTVTPLEAGLGWIAKLNKGAPFIGLEPLRRQKAQGLTRRLAGFRLNGKAIPRHGYPVWHGGQAVDQVRSGAMSPSLGYPIGTTYLPVSACEPGTALEVEVRGERVPAEVVKLPFWTQGTVRRPATPSRST